MKSGSSTARAIDLPHENFGSYFLDTFDRPRRVSGCECERSSGATLAQVLLLANSNEIESKINDGNGRIAQMIQQKLSMRNMIDELYLAAYARFPTAEELNTTMAYVEQQSNKQEAIEDTLWALLNSKEFMFNH